MRQLDLFGMPVETNEKAAVNEAVDQANVEVEETEVLIDPRMAETEEIVLENDVIQTQSLEDTEPFYASAPEEFISEAPSSELRIEEVTDLEITEEETVKIKLSEPLRKRGRKSFKEIDAELDLIEIPEDDILFQKQYYAISEVASWFKVNTSLLRFWETEFDVLKPRKNRKGDRLFRPEDVKNLQIIYYLLRNRKFTIEGAKEYIKTNRKKAEGNIQIIQSLTKFRSFLVELRANLD